MNRLLATTMLVLLGFIWGSGYTLAKFALSNGITPFGYAFWQTLGPALFLSLLTLIQQNRALLQKNNWIFLSQCALFGIVIPNTAIYFVSVHLPAGLLAVLVNTVPLVVYVVALFYQQEAFDYRRLLAVVLGLSGLLLIVFPGGVQPFSWWILLALISPLSFGICAVYITIHCPKTLQPMPCAAGMLIMATIFFMPFVVYYHAFFPLSSVANPVNQAVLLEILLSSIGYLLFFQLLRLAGPVFYSLTNGIVALTGLFWGRLIFKEIPSFLQVCASICIIMAICLLSQNPRR